MAKAKFKYKDQHRVVVRKTQTAAEAVGLRFGSFVMRTARQSLKRPRKDGEPSPPGTPPRATPTFKKNILFALDGQTVVIGPRKLGDAAYDDTLAALEVGAQTTRRVGRKRRTVRAEYRERPFMVPALEKNIDSLAKLWAGVVKA